MTARPGSSKRRQKHHTMSGNLNYICVVIILVLFSTMLTVKGRKQNIYKRFTKDEVCKETIQTIEKVENCPAEEKVYKQRSQKKRCEHISHVSCSEEVYMYHCVRYNNDLIEVCAPSGLITGSCCAQFNDGVGRVIEDYNMPCAECPMNYYSHESNRYSRCVKPITTVSISTIRPSQDDEVITGNVTEQMIRTYGSKQNGTMNSNLANSTTEEEKHEIGENSLTTVLISIIIVAVIVSIIIPIACCLQNRKCRVCSTSKKMDPEKQHMHAYNGTLIEDSHKNEDNENGDPVLQTLPTCII